MTQAARAVLDAAMSETEWQQTVISAAAALGWVAYHTRDSRGCERGFPDLILLRGSDLLALELKRERDTTSKRRRAEQQVWLEAFASVTRVRSMRAKPSDWDAVERLLRGEA